MPSGKISFVLLTVAIIIAVASAIALTNKDVTGKADFHPTPIGANTTDAENGKTAMLESRLRNAHGVLTNMMVKQDKDIPLFMSYVDEKTNMLVVGIEDTATGSTEEYKTKLAALFGADLPIKIIIGHFEET